MVLKKQVTVGILIVFLMTGACTPSHYRLNYSRFFSESMKKKMDYGMYVPPDWDGTTSLPLIVFLHGNGDSETCFDKHRVAAVLDEAITSKTLPPFLMVVPNGDRGFWRNYHDGSRHYEDYVVEDLIPRIRKRYPVLAGRDGCHLMGVSMGGYGALSVALHHRERFRSVFALSGMLFNTDEAIQFVKKWRFLGITRIFGPAEDRDRIDADNCYTLLKSENDLKGLQLMIGVGKSDTDDVRKTTDQFHDYLSRRVIPHLYLQYDGGHNWIAWSKIVPAAIAVQVFNRSIDDFHHDPFFALKHVKGGR
jgi:enterochelin esterase-like enzyme